jgi:hypothetical protein
MSKIFRCYEDAVNAIFPILEEREDLGDIYDYIGEAIYQLFDPSSRKKISTIVSNNTFIKPHTSYKNSIPMQFVGIYLPKSTAFLNRYMFQIETKGYLGPDILTVEIEINKLNTRKFIICAEYRYERLWEV